MKGGKALCRAAMLTRAVWQVGRLSLGLRQRKASGGQKRPGSRSRGRAAGLDLQTALSEIITLCSTFLSDGP